MNTCKTFIILAVGGLLWSCNCSKQPDMMKSERTEWFLNELALGYWDLKYKFPTSYMQTRDTEAWFFEQYRAEDSVLLRHASEIKYINYDTALLITYRGDTLVLVQLPCSCESCMLSCGTTNRQQKSDRYGKIEGYVFLREQYPQTMLNEVLGDGRRDSTYAFIFVPSKYVVPQLDMNDRDIIINYDNGATLFLLNYPFRDNPQLVEYAEQSGCKGFTESLVREFNDTLAALVVKPLMESNYIPPDKECAGESQGLCWRYIRKEFVTYGYKAVLESERKYWGAVIEKWYLSHEPVSQKKLSSLRFGGLKGYNYGTEKAIRH